MGVGRVKPGTEQAQEQEEEAATPTRRLLCQSKQARGTTYKEGLERVKKGGR